MGNVRISNFVNDNHIGKFRLPSNFDRQDEINDTLAVMSNVIVTKCEHLWHSIEFEYIAFSPLFDSVERYETPPEYIFVIECDDDGEIIGVRADRKT